MDAEIWAVWAGVAVAIVAAGIAFSQARSARAALRDTREAREAAQDQAHSARESADSSRRSAHAAVDSARSARESVEIARKSYDREDEPKFEHSWEQGTDRIGVILKMISGPPGVDIDVSWHAEYWTQVSASGSRHGVMNIGGGQGTYHVVRGDSFGFPVRRDPQYIEGKITATLHCRDQADAARTWNCPLIIEWNVPPGPTP